MPGSQSVLAYLRDGDPYLHIFYRKLNPNLYVGHWVAAAEALFLGLSCVTPGESQFCFFYDGHPLENNGKLADIPDFDVEKVGWGLRGEYAQTLEEEHEMWLYPLKR